MENTLKTSLLMILLLIGVNMRAQQSSVEFGIKGGANLSNIGGDWSEFTKAKLGFNIGVTVDYNFSSNISFLTGLEYTTKGAKMKHIDKSTIASFIQVPIHIGYKLNLSKTTKIVLRGGSYIAFGVAGKTYLLLENESGFITERFYTFGDSGFLSRADFGLGLGTGIEFGKIICGLGWDFGLINLSQGRGSMKMKNAYLSVGYKF